MGVEPTPDLTGPTTILKTADATGRQPPPGQRRKIVADSLTTPYPSAKMPLRFLAEIAQLVEQCTENAWVLSSSLSLGTRLGQHNRSWSAPQFAGLVQLVEHLLAKEKVVGSSPIARSTKNLPPGRFFVVCPSKNGDYFVCDDGGGWFSCPNITHPPTKPASAPLNPPMSEKTHGTSDVVVS